MNHRVIFMPDDFWTNPPKETTVTENYADTPRAADARRAAAITIHHRRTDIDGVLAIAHEVNEIHRGTELVLAILDLHSSPLIELRTPNGIDLMGRHVQELAAHADTAVDEPSASDIGRAATLLDSHGRGDTDGINKAMQSAIDAGRSTQLLLGLLDLYEHLLPELSSTAGVDWLHRCIATYANEENQQ